MDVDLGFRINWISVGIFLVLAIAIALYARHVSGGWMRPWISIKPLWWFLLLFFVPPLGLLLLIVNLVVHRHTGSHHWPGCFRLNVQPSNRNAEVGAGVRSPL